WVHPGDVVDKIEEETRELRQALSESSSKAAEELGDLLFSVANFARKLGIEPESALRAANDKFTDRFERLETEFERQDRSVHGATLEEMERVWNLIKGKGQLKGKGQRTEGKSKLQGRRAKGREK